MFRTKRNSPTRRKIRQVSDVFPAAISARTKEKCLQGKESMTQVDSTQAGRSLSIKARSHVSDMKGPRKHSICEPL